MFKVIKFFTDLQDNNHPYQVGDIFPRPDMIVSKERIAELSSSKNARGVPLIEEIKESPIVIEDKEESGESEEKAEKQKKKK